MSRPCGAGVSLHALAELSDAQPFATRALGAGSRPSNRLQNRCSLLQDTLMFDPVQAPSLRHAFELVNAAVPEADSGLRH